MALKGTPGTGPVRTKAQREADLALVADWYCRGWSQQAMADRIAVLRKEWGYSVNRRSIANDLKEVQERWLASQRMSFDEAKGKELAKIDNLERIYWVQYDESRRTLETTITEQREPLNAVPAPREPQNAVTAGNAGNMPRNANGSKRALIKREQRHPDLDCLRGVQWCIDRRCKLLGLDAPERQEITLRAEAEKLGRELGLTADEVLAEADAVLGFRGRR